MPLSVVYNIIQIAILGYFTDLDFKKVIFDDFPAHLRQHLGKNSTNVVFQMSISLWIVRVDTVFSITLQKKSKEYKLYDLDDQLTLPYRKIILQILIAFPDHHALISEPIKLYTSGDTSPNAKFATMSHTTSSYSVHVVESINFGLCPHFQLQQQYFWLNSITMMSRPYDVSHGLSLFKFTHYT